MITTKAKIEDILISAHSGFACSKQFEATEKTGVLHLRPNNVGYWGVVNLSKKIYIQKDKIEPSKVGIKKGQLLFNNTNSKELVGRVVVAKEDIDAGFSNHITRLIVDDTRIDPRWLAHYINKLWADKYFFHICKKWIGQAGVDTSMLKNIEIEYPDIAEQRKIADRLDNVFEEVVNGITLITKENNQTNEYKQSLLSNVFSTPDFQLVKLGELLEYRNGLWAGKSGKLTDAKVIRVTEMRDDGSYDLSTAKELKVEERKLNTRKVTPNTILLERSGGGENKPVGRVILFGNNVLEDTYSFSNFTTLLIPKTELVLPKYLFYFTYNFHLSGNTKNLQKAVTGIRNLDFTKYLEQEVPIPFKNGKPDLDRQKIMTDELDNGFATSEKLRDLFNKQERYFISLRSSVLNKYFQLTT